MSDQNCIFCRIVSGEIPARTVYEDDLCLAFHDTNPQAPVHILVIPRTHIASLYDMKADDEAALGRVMRVAATVAGEQGLQESGFRTVINTGREAGQSVFHIHAHIIGGRSLS